MERNQAELFLDGLIKHEPIEHRGPLDDPPDMRVPRRGLPDLFLEIVEYHPEGDRVGIEKRWRTELWPTIDALRRQRPALVNSTAIVNFKDHDRPPGRKHHANLASELVELSEFLMARLTADGQEIQVSFTKRDTIGPFQVISPGWEWLPEETWPTVASHVASFRLCRKDGIRWLAWSCLQSDAGVVNHSKEEFRRIFESKLHKVQAAIASGKFDPSLGPLWLLIVSDTGNDISSHIFPTAPEDFAQLAQVVAAVGFDFHVSPFDEIWQLSHFSGRRLRLFPETAS